MHLHLCFILKNALPFFCLEASSGQNITLNISRQGNLDIYKQKNYLVNYLTKDLDWTGAQRWQEDGALEALEDFI